MAEELEIIIGANVDDAKQGINSLSKTLDDFAKQGKLSIGVLEQTLVNLRTTLKQTTNPEDARKLGEAIKTVQDRLSQLKISGGLVQQLGGVSRATRIAHTDIEQLGHSLELIASGSGGGISALGNLIFTFERLQGVAGGTSSAMAELGKVLASPAGIVAGVGAVVAIVTELSKELFNNSEAIDNNKKALDSITDSITTVKDNVDKLTKAFQFFNQLGAINVKISGLGSIQDLREQSVAQRQLTADLEDQIKAAKELAEAAKLQRQEAQKTFEGTITFLPGAAARIQERKEELEEAKKVEKAANDELERLQKQRTDSEQQQIIIFRLIEAQKIENQKNAIKQGDALRAQEIDNIKSTIARAKAAAEELGAAFIIPLDDRIASNALRETSDFYAKLIEQRQKLVQSLKQIDINEALTGVDKTKLKEKVQIQIFEIDKKLLAEDFAAAKKFLHDQAIGFKIALPVDITLPKAIPEQEKANFKKSIDNLLKQVSAPLKLALQTPSLQEDIDALRKKLQETIKFDPKNITDSLNAIKQKVLSDQELADILKLSLTLNADPVQFSKAIEDAKKFLSKKDVIKLDIALDAQDIDATGFLQSIANLTKDVNAAIEKALEGISTEALATLGQTIGDALSGGDIGKGFEEFGKALGQAVEALGKQLIALGVATAIAKAGLRSLNPALTIAAGIALVAIGEALKNLLGGGLQGFEKGGRPPVGEWVIVGEKGPELVKFDQPGRVFSNSESQRMLSSSVSSSSVKEHETIKEYLIANRVSQTVKEYFNTSFTERIKEGIRLSLVPIETKISDSVRSMATNNDKLTAYTYKLHEQSSSMIERLTSVTEDRSTINRLHESVTNNVESLKESFKSITNHNNSISFAKISSLNDSSSIANYVKHYFTSTDKDHLIKTDSIEKYYDTIKNIVSSFKEQKVFSEKPSLATIVKGDNESLHYENFIKNAVNSFNEKISDRLIERFTRDNNSSESDRHSSYEILSKLIQSEKYYSSVSSAIEKLSTINDSNEVRTSIDKLHECISTINNSTAITASIDKLHEKISERSDKSVTIERIINNNFFSSDSFKETFKSMSLTDLQKTFHIPAFAQGGAVFGPTLAILGEGFGISRGNPEFVGTRSQLSGIQGGQFDVNVNVDGELSFSMGKLAIALNREQRSSFRTSGKPPF